MIQKSIIPIAIITTIGGVQQANATTFILKSSEQDTLSRQQVFSKAQDIIAKELWLEKNDVRLKSKITDDLNASSLDFVAVIFELEKGFEIPIPDAIADKIKTVEDAVEYIYTRVNTEIRRSTIAQKISRITIEKLGVAQSEITSKAKFTNDLGADSLDIVEIIMEIEEEFNLSIPDAAAEKIITVEDAVDYIYKRVNENL